MTRPESAAEGGGAVAGASAVDCTMRSTTNAVMSTTIKNPTNTTLEPRTRWVSMAGTYPRRCGEAT